jgi:hypothetical protein
VSARRILATASLLTAALSAVVAVVFVVLASGHARPVGAGMTGGVSAVMLTVAGLAFALVGRLVVERVPGNRLGPIMCAAGLALSVSIAAGVYANYAVFVADPRLPGAAPAVLVYDVPGPASFGLVGVALMLFPDGRLPSRRWRPALAVVLTGVAAVMAGYLLRPGGGDEPFQSVENPLGIPGAFDATDGLAGLGWSLMGLGVAVAAVAMVVRLRRSAGVERQQLKWMGLAASIIGVIFVSVELTYFGELEGGVATLRDTALAVGITAFPVAAGIAILRHRLYDVDVVINRTLVYGALTATLAVAYLAIVLLLQLALDPVTSGSSLAVAVSTLAVAALFRPARSRIQEAVDRRFYRRRYDAARTLEAFSVRLREQVDLEALGAELGFVVRETMEPAHVSLWLRGADR